MSAYRKPIRVTAERFAALLEPDPAAEHGWRWRIRQPSEFGGDERICAAWNAKNAGRAVGKQDSSGRVVITIDHQTCDLRRIKEELGEAIDAIVSSSPGNSDDVTNGDGVGSGKLANVIRAASQMSKLPLGEFTVLGRMRDPYRIDTPKGHREGRWFARWFDQLFASTAIVHLRGFHYVLISHGGVVKPNGAPYENTVEDFIWLIDEAAKAARWLGYVGFDRIKDQRNDAPVTYRPEKPEASSPTVSVHAMVFGGYWATSGIEIETPAVSVGGEASIFSMACKPWPSLSGLGVDQPYCFAFFGEKSSLREVLEPIAERYGANMYLCAGEISDTLVFEMARDADADGRPLVVFTFSDFDPAGWQMPVSIGRKLQALRDFQFPALRAQIVPVSMTLEQVIAERLPTTMVKAKEARRVRWDREFGPALREAGLATDGEPAQVEIDALASIRPDVLRRITLEKLALYRDETIEQRVRAVRDRWSRAAQLEVDAQIAQIDQGRLDEIKQAAEEAVEQFNDARDDLIEAVAEAQEAFNESLAQPMADLDEAKNRMVEIDRDLNLVVQQIRPPAPPEQLQAEIDTGAHEPLIDLDWSFRDITAALKAHKAYGGEGEDSEEAP